MADDRITDLAGLAKIADSKLAQQIYSDGIQKGTTELGQLVGELSKTTRMVLQPLFTALQGATGRLDSWVADAVGQVPPERRVEAKPALLNATVAAIGAEDDHSELRDNYVRLLASMIDCERQGDVHRAFPQLLKEMSPLDALLLQITPYGAEVGLPVGLEQPSYHFSSGLVATWETWKAGKVDVGRYRFFCRVKKQRPEALGKSSFVGKASDHAGFLELILPQKPLFQDKSLAWHNLERLRLVSRVDAKDARGNLQEHFWSEPDALNHIKSLIIGDTFFGAHMYVRTELGRSFARCCVPVYAGDAKWHPVERPE